MKTKGLTIQEAIQSGLPFKRPNDLAWIKNNRHKDIYSITLVPDDIIATDWEIKVPEVTITREKLAEAWDKVVEPWDMSGMGKAYASECFDAFCKELGL